MVRVEHDDVSSPNDCPIRVTVNGRDKCKCHYGNWTKCEFIIRNSFPQSSTRRADLCKLINYKIINCKTANVSHAARPGFGHSRAYRWP